MEVTWTYRKMLMNKFLIVKNEKLTIVNAIMGALLPWIIHTIVLQKCLVDDSFNNYNSFTQ
jgi:hypothetical protein